MNSAVSVILFSQRNPSVLAEAEERIRQYLERASSGWELVLPQTPIAVSEGFEEALKASIQGVKNDTVVLWNAEIFSPIKEIEVLLPFLREGCDLVVGSRYRPEESIVKRRGSFFAYFREWLKNLTLRLRYGFEISDYLSGCLAFRKSWFLRLCEENNLQSKSTLPIFLRDCKRKGSWVKEVGIMWIFRS